MDAANAPDVKTAMQGQMLVIFALVLVVLLAMAGLAIDVSRARLVAEEAQQAVDAGSTAGVAFLPGSTDLAAQQAVQLATENGFSCTNPTIANNTTILGRGNERYVYTCGSGTTITVDAYATSDQLQETIQTQVPSLLLGVVHRTFFTVARTAKATYQDPIVMGAPDPMLGYAPYVTHAFDYTCSTVDKANGCSGDYGSNVAAGIGSTGSITVTGATKRPQGFWLEIKGPYDGLEHGDAFSPYFETVSGDNLKDLGGRTNGTITDPCTTDTPGKCIDSTTPTAGTHDNEVVLNPYYNLENTSAKTNLTGYSFLFTIPGTPGGKTAMPVELKVLDPLDECYYDPYQPGGSGGLGTNKYNWKATGTNVTSLTGPSPADVDLGDDELDQCGDPGNNVSSTAGLSGYYASPSNIFPNDKGVGQGNGDFFPTSLSFTLYEPVPSLSSDRVPATSGTVGSYTVTLANPGTSYEQYGHGLTLGNTYGSQPLVLGPEFQSTCTSGDCYPVHQYEWFNLADVTNASTSPAYVMLVINSVVNKGNFSTTNNNYSGTYGTGGNVFSLGVCAQDAALNYPGDPTVSYAWSPAVIDKSGYNAGDLAGQETVHGTDGCIDPNTTAAGYPSSGYAVNALQGMCIMSEVTSSSAYIPLGSIPAQFQNGTVDVRLFDAGDVSGTLELGLLAPWDAGIYQTGSITSDWKDWATSPILTTTSESYQLDVAAPAGSGYSTTADHAASIGYSYNEFWPGGTASCTGDTDYGADTHQNFDGGEYPSCGGGTTSMVAASSCDSSGKNCSSNFANGTWLDFNLVLNSSYIYKSGVYGNTWWKMNYYLPASSAAGTDCTTWWMSSVASPVHLTSP